MFNKNKIKKILYIEKEHDFWSYSDALSFFHDIANDLSYYELKKLINIMEIRLSLKKCINKEVDTNV